VMREAGARGINHQVFGGDSRLRARAAGAAIIGHVADAPLGSAAAKGRVGLSQ
jgi:hypothetical protein